MAELKTKRNEGDVKAFLNSIQDEQKRSDGFKLLDLMQKVTGFKPEMWGDSIVGFGSYHYKYESGREGDWFMVGFSPREQNLSLYAMPNLDSYSELLNDLGRHSTGKSCIYIRKLDDINIEVLKKLIRESVRKLFVQSS
ncbi:MAG: DUF1801 domain-containing protein [Calditrichaeota bacterium]|nr:DUF1801 domain-containing protein [Calditrichota bacterium]